MPQGPIYLDYNATTPIAPEVAAAMLPYLHEHFGNPSSSHAYGQKARQAVEDRGLPHVRPARQGDEPGPKARGHRDLSEGARAGRGSHQGEIRTRRELRRDRVAALAAAGIRTSGMSLPRIRRAMRAWVRSISPPSLS